MTKLPHTSLRNLKILYFAEARKTCKIINFTTHVLASTVVLSQKYFKQRGMLLSSSEKKRS